MRYINILFLLLLLGCEPENKSPWIFQATYDAGSSSSFAFRADSTYQWTNGSGLGVSTYEGKYILQGGMFMLDKIGFDNVVKSKFLFITTEHPLTHHAGKYLIQVDEHTNLVDSIFIFKVYLDVRDSFKSIRANEH